MTCLKRFLFCSIALASGILSVSLAHAGDARTADDEAIQVWVGTYEDHQEEGIAYGCGAFLLPVDTGIPRSGDAAEDLRLALEALFAPELEHPEAETETGLKDMRLSVEEIAIVEERRRLSSAAGCWVPATAAMRSSRARFYIQSSNSRPLNARLSRMAKSTFGR